jgi:hypothetical protein
VINTTGDLALITDGERRYGQVLFELCSELVRTGKRGRPPRTLLKGVQVRIKNKGSHAHKRGRKRPKYQAPCREHPQTSSAIENAQIHANHLEAFNASLCRRCAAYRRKTILTPKRKNGSSNASMSTGSSITPTAKPPPMAVRITKALP